MLCYNPQITLARISSLTLNNPGFFVINSPVSHPGSSGQKPAISAACDAPGEGGERRLRRLALLEPGGVFFGRVFLGRKKLEQLSKVGEFFPIHFFWVKKWPLISSIYFWEKKMFDQFPEDPWDDCIFT